MFLSECFYMSDLVVLCWLYSVRDQEMKSEVLNGALCWSWLETVAQLCLFSFYEQGPMGPRGPTGSSGKPGEDVSVSAVRL